MKIPTATAPKIAFATGAVLIITIALVTLIQFFMGWRATPVDMIGLHYTGGPIDGQQFVRIIEPGSGSRFLGLQDQLALLPVTQRDYTASEDDGADGPPIVAPARGGVDMKFDVGAYFTLNTNADVARRFYERVCIKFECDSDEGWNAMLKVNFRRPIEQAIQQSIRDYTVNELYAGVPEGGAATDEEATVILERVQNQISADLTENVNTVVGGVSFCEPTFDRSVADCPSSSSSSPARPPPATPSATPSTDNPNCTVVFTDGSTGVNVQTGSPTGG